ncbi:MAG TPA: SRPBCC family protein [Longimicrobiales bacterium]|jgi:carbon monoxide dehydrogenase subunit G
MAVRIEETFRVRAPVERVWAFLLDPHQVVQCLPGAELIEARDERTFLGRVRVKVGPITASYRGKAELTEVDEQNHRVQMTGEGQDTAGSGSARMTMTSSIVAGADGAAEVSVESEVQLVGKLAQFGRGMVEEVSKQLFRQFAECARQRLEAQAAPAAGEAGPAAAADDAGRAPAPAAGAAPGPSSAAGASLAGAGPTAAGAGHARAAASAATMTSPPPTTAAPATKPVSILPLLLRALRARIARLFGRTEA